VAAQQDRLSRLLRDQYVAGGEDRIKLLLSGDNPNRINRDLQYMGYASKAQAQLLDSLRANLQAVEKSKAEMQDTKDELDEIAQEQHRQKAVLEKEKAARAALLSQLSARLAAQRREAGHVARDEERLTSLVDKLARLIEEQRKAELAEANRRRQQAIEAARVRAQRLERQKQQAKAKKPRQDATSLTQNNPDAIDADENPSKTVARNELAADASVQSGVFAGSFSALRGQLRLPVKGELLAKYGMKRSDGPNWKGLFIRAPEGAEVRAVAAGRIVFAEWLRGFGNLLILDHGGQYMTIYGNNQAVLKRAGDTVKAGDVIASAGNSGGNEQSGLYFEMRHQGRAFDPLGWMNSR
jgi:septal ring factor EnvC (AmiA/AmiB activator)